MNTLAAANVHGDVIRRAPIAGEPVGQAMNRAGTLLLISLALQGCHPNTPDCEPVTRPVSPRTAEPLVLNIASVHGSSAPTPEEQFAVFDPNVRASAMALADDGSIYLVGRARREPLESPPEKRPQIPRSDTRPVLDELPYDGIGWVARYASSGDPIWQRRIELGSGLSESFIHDVTRRPDGSACALAHHNLSDYNGSVRCFGPDGDLVALFEPPMPQSTRILALADGSLVAGGSKVLAWRGGRAYTAAWIGDVFRAPPLWEATQTGDFGGTSSVSAMARTNDGDIITGGYLGRSARSDASLPWIARWTARGELLWSVPMRLWKWSHQAVRAVAVTAAGDILAAGFSHDASWVRRYNGDGRLVSEHRFDPTDQYTSVLAVPGGYVVGGWSDSAYTYGPVGPARWSIRSYNDAGELLWASTRNDCKGILQLARHGTTVLALGECSGLGLIAYQPP